MRYLWDNKDEDNIYTLSPLARCERSLLLFVSIPTVKAIYPLSTSLDYNIDSIQVIYYYIHIPSSDLEPRIQDNIIQLYVYLTDTESDTLIRCSVSVIFYYLELSYNITILLSNKYPYSKHTLFNPRWLVFVCQNCIWINNRVTADQCRR